MKSIEEQLDEEIGKADLKKLYWLSVAVPIGVVAAIAAILMLAFAIDKDAPLQPDGIITASAFAGMLTIWITSNLLEAGRRKEDGKRWKERQDVLEAIRDSNERMAKVISER